MNGAMKGMSDPDLRMPSARDMRYYELATMLAMNSACRFQMGSVIALGARIFALGTNVIKTHPVQKRYGSHVVSIHAEYSAILHARCDLTGSTLYVARYRNLISKPCAACALLMVEAGIKSMVYHDGKTVVKCHLTG